MLIASLFAGKVFLQWHFLAKLNLLKDQKTTWELKKNFVQEILFISVYYQPLEQLIYFTDLIKVLLEDAKSQNIIN